MWAETFDEPAYDKEVRGIIETVKSFAEKYKKHIPVITAGGFLIIRTFCTSLSLARRRSGGDEICDD